MDIFAAISALGASVKAAKDYFEGNREAQAKIGELGLQIMDVQQRAMEMMEQIRDLQTRLQEAEEKQHLGDVVYFQNEVCWRKDKEGQEKGPYCHVCWEKDRKLIHLDDMTDEFRSDWLCRVCKGSFWIK